ncbi:ABC transporter permease subunit [Conexibacter woesei]|uniref:Transmembrane transport protein n=1 Tax=Conexibacter woesei (strain DSM 14684 / CCUG 47730 / CIP 108061 / JCM 11494 / NBRC 100937 / ID131577) TaxID=469383 RepID=D3FBE4_CONWI|nr:ABC transporter permease subunit [Conexibacter woesei]ADB49313.1 hypothetical protein Cwoe_0880 [Conexibacter woesei DSM 14684]
MIWLTWRQFRAQGAIVSVAVAAIALALAATGAGLADLKDASESSFFQAFTSDSARSALYYTGYMAVLAAPAIVGVFWGAPLVARELESGTHRLVWNQTVTRTRWLATKAGFTCLAAMVVVGLLSLVVSWWSSPIDAVVNNGHGAEGFFGLPRISPAVFDARGIAPIGYAAFAVALGVTAGAVIRRTVPAMAVTLAVFVAVQVAVPLWIRPNLGPTEHTFAITAQNLRGLIVEGDGPIEAGAPADAVKELHVTLGRPGAWIVSQQTLDTSGKPLDTLPGWIAECVPDPGPGPGPTGRPACFARLAEQGYRQRVTYQPASRYWTLQAYETAVFAGLAAALFGFSFWWVRRRLS